MRRWAWPLGPEGLALPLTLFALTLLALLAAALAGVTASELQAGRFAEWDRHAAYVAEAGIEHQLFAFKVNRNASSVGTVNLGGHPLRRQYVVNARTGSPGGVCTDDLLEDESWWEITSFGQLWRGAELVHQRSISALVQVVYPINLPFKVTVCRWRPG